MRYYISLLALLLLCACTSPGVAPTGSAPLPDLAPAGPAPKYSLAQWTFHEALFAGEMTTFDFIETAGELGFDGVEYVNQFFMDKADNLGYLDSLNAAAEKAGVKNVLIMVDRAGNLGASKAAERQEAIDLHMQWVRAAKRLGCADIRVNAYGDGTPREMMAQCIDGIGRLASQAKAEGVGIIIENHGGISGNGAWLAELVGRLQEQGVGTLPDFDNWCIARSNGQMWGGECIDRYDRYQGLQELMPYARALSVKAFDFDEYGRETRMDYETLFDIVRAADYDGYLGVEFEGGDMEPREGIAKIRTLVDRVWYDKQVVDATAVERIDRTLKDFVDRKDIAGVSALIYEKDKEVYFRAFGAADQADGTPMKRNTIAQIYSMTKPITGVALMQLYEKGKFQLDDPLANYLPEYANMLVYTGVDDEGNMLTELANRPITVRDITRHTAGFYNGGNTPGLQEAYEAADLRSTGTTLTTASQRLAKLPLLFQPGTQWHYGPSVDVQARLVEQLSGQPFDEYLRQHILDPLGMDDTRFFVPADDRGRMASSFRRDADGTLNQVSDAEAHAFNISPQTLTPGGFGLTSTLDDYMTFARMLVNKGTYFGKTILKPETVALMSTSHLSDEVTERLWLPSKGQVGFGVDFAVRQRPPATAEENPGAVGEFFWDGAASTLFWVDPAHELTAVLFVQLFPYDQVGLHHDFRQAVYGPFVDCYPDFAEE